MAWIDSVSTRGPVSPHKACQTSTASGHRHTQTRLVNGSAEYSSKHAALKALCSMSRALLGSAIRSN